VSTIIFFGAGKLGKYMLDLWEQLGIQPDFFADNSEKNKGSFYCGIKVLSIEEVKSMENIQILITCNQIDNILNQLLDCGINEKNIFKANTLYHMLIFLTLHMRGKLHWNALQKTSKNLENLSSYSVIFDVQYGFVLGGVESWVLHTANQLPFQEKEVKFISTDMRISSKYNLDNREILLKEWRKLPEKNKLNECLTVIKMNLPCNIVCNFPDFIFWSACIAKILWPQEVNLIAVVHNDADIYYNQYSEMEASIDWCLTISTKIKNSLLRKGFPIEKIRDLNWKISLNNKLERSYSKKGHILRLGYAGRVTLEQKRVDLLITISEKLKDLGVEFTLEIAGIGDYLQTVRAIIKKYELENQVKLLGLISNDKISEFWKCKDIALSCSEFEGRSISQAEAMAAGAVPVITDTSGARDYVEDSYNGFIVPVGDVEAMVNRIYYLYYHRELVEIMGRRSHEVIIRQNEENNIEALWNKILK